MNADNTDANLLCMEKTVIQRVISSLATGRECKLRAVELLETHDVPHSLQHVLHLAKHGNPEVRARSLQLLGNYKCRQSASALVGALRDADMLVRTAAAESIGDLRPAEGFMPLVRAMDDKSPFVRAAASLSLTHYPSFKAKQALQKRLAMESNSSVKLRICAALYSLGDFSMLDKVTPFLKDRNYRNRCAAANYLGGINKGRDVSRVRRILTDTLAAENVVAVKSSIEAALQEMDASCETVKQ